MLKIIICLILLTVVEVSRNGIFAIAVTTPLLAKLQPQPSLAPADTEHAGYVEALTPILHTTPLITTAALFPAAVTTVQHLPAASITANNRSVPFNLSEIRCISNRVQFDMLIHSCDCYETADNRLKSVNNVVMNMFRPSAATKLAYFPLFDE
uniref:Uncharacterized protein n=1 Tax=Glossina austeni TaxID=7395 RepID=A0A1A9UJ37_GLOAU